MKRVWVIFTIAAALSINPVFTQDTGKTDPKTTTTTTEPGKTDATKTDASKPAEGAGTGAVIWKDKNGANFANSKVKFVLTAKDTVSQVDYIEYRVDDGQFLKYSGPVPVLEEGPHTIVYRAVDKAGNREVDQAYTVTIDNAPPAISILPAKQFVTKVEGKAFSATGNSFTIRVIDNYAGIKSVKYSVNSNEMKDYANETITLSNPGTQVVKYLAEDNLGNKVEGTLMVEVDSEKPSVDIVPSSPLIPVAEKNYARRGTAFKVRGLDTGAGVDRILVRIDEGQEWLTYTDVLYFDTEKDHSIEAKVQDAVGNESEVKKISFTVDDNPPITELKASVE